MLSDKQLKGLYKVYKANYGYLWFKNFNDSEQFFNYLKNNRLVVSSVKHGADRDVIEGWGYSVRDTALIMQ